MILDKESDNYLKEVIAEFTQAPCHNQYQHKIKPPYGKQNLPLLSLWSPLESSNVEIICPHHSVPLSHGMWTDDLVTPRSVRNSRLIYDVFYNFLLVQQFYHCHCENHPSHRFLSLYIKILTQLPNEILVKFRIIKYHRCLFSYKLVDCIFDQISRNVNFLQFSKAIAQLHINTYCTMYTTFAGNDAYNKVLESVMFSFPSSDKVKDVFLDVFNVRKEQYILDMESIPIGSMTAADATFKISKPIGFRRKGNNKIVRQYNNLFIFLNGNREVVQWKLCLNLRNEDIREMLEKIAERNPNKGVG